MATESIPAAELMPATATQRSALGPKDIAVAIMTPLASLKLTVFLLVAATLVTWIATLEQTRDDIWQVKTKHFENALVEVPFQIFFVPAWFPSLQNVQGSFYVPSGVTILIALLVNLIAAHLLRYRVQAKGGRLAFGVLASIAAAVLTWAVVFNGQNADGFQAQPPISWLLMWRMLQVGILGIGITAAYGVATMDPDRRTERIVLGLGGVVCLAALVVTFILGEKSFIGDSAMRILWQLIQASVAGTAALAACMLLFKRKAGIVVVHLGIAGLMMNELYVTATNEEQRMMIREGQTVSTAIDIREVELVAVNQSDPKVDEIVVVPGEQLRSGAWIAHPDLPFEVRCDSYLQNAQIVRATGASTNLATKGLGREWIAASTDVGVGTDAQQSADMATAYVMLRSKDGQEPMGTHMVSQAAWESGLVDSVEAAGKTWQIGLRFKTAYKPYSLTLKDVQAEYYLSTSIPKWFASEVELDDSRTGTKSDQRIWMNNPLRYADETFYQSSYERGLDGTEVTVLQVVRNEGWMIPYVCCMFTVIGLVAQFGSSLTSHLEKERKKVRKNAADAMLAAKKTGSKPKRNVPILAIVLTSIFGLYVAGQFAKSTRSKPTAEGFQLDRLGAIPVSYNGRVQPLDSVARNMVRQLGNRETVVDATGESKVQAIRWLADTVFERKGFGDYRLIRIESSTVQDALGLPKKRDRFLYSLDELLGADKKVIELTSESRKKHATATDLNLNKWPLFHQRLWSVGEKLRKVINLRVAFGDPRQRVGDAVGRRLQYGKSVVATKNLPLAVPTDDAERPWISFAESQNRQWLRDLAKEWNVTSTSALADKVVDLEVIGPMRDDMIKSQIIQRMVSDEDVIELLKKSTGESDPRKLAQLLQDNWDDFPKETYAELAKSVEPLVDAMLQRQRTRVTGVVRAEVEQVLGGETGLAADDAGRGGSTYPDLASRLELSYVAEKAEDFNGALDEYLAAVATKTPTGMGARGVRWEQVYNAVSPFHLAMVLYFAAAIIAALGWLGLMHQFQRASSWLLLLGLSIHITGIVMRVVISGRPPVTNLYSSALFVSAGYLMLMLIVERVTRIGIGNALAGFGGTCALLWAWTMSITDGDTFAVLLAVLDTQFWLSTHVIIISLGYSATLAAGFLGVAYVISGLLTDAQTPETRKTFANVIYGMICFGVLASFFGTVLGGLWGDDSWGRFWGWDPKENGALMIVLWNAMLLHARWGGLVKTRGLAALAILGNVITLWSWKGVNALGVGLHAYAATEDTSVLWILVLVACLLTTFAIAMIPTRFWVSYADER